MNRSRKLIYICLSVLLLVAAFFLGALYKSALSAFQDPVTYPLDSLVLVSRSPLWDVVNGFYSAVIILEKESEGFSVVCKVHVGDMNYYQNIPLGRVSSKSEAYATWGKVEWTEESLKIGKNVNYLVVIGRSDIQRHR